MQDFWQVTFVADDVQPARHGLQRVGRYRGKAPGNHDDCVRADLPAFSNLPATLGRCNMCDAAGVDHHEVRLGVCRDGLQTKTLEKLADLLAFVLVDLAAKCFNGERLHNEHDRIPIRGRQARLCGSPDSIARESTHGGNQ